MKCFKPLLVKSSPVQCCAGSCVILDTSCSSSVRVTQTLLAALHGDTYAILYTLVVSRKSIILDVSVDHAATYRPEAAAVLTVYTSGPFVPLPSLRMQLDLCRPVTMFASPHCVTELHETFRTGCQRMC